jgi:hypothetical protein
MTLPYRLPSKTQIPPGCEAHYLEKDGAFVLDVAGAVETQRLDEARADNFALKQQVQSLETQFQGIDPAQARALLQKAQELEDAQLVKAGEVEKLITKRLQAARADFESKLQTAAAERDTLNAQLSEIRINQKVIETATRRGLRPTAIPDLLSRAHSVFRLAHGQPAAFEADGQTPRRGQDGQPLTLDEWTEKLAAEAPHLFDKSAGGGSLGGTPDDRPTAPARSKPAEAARNPFRKQTWNLTEQMRLRRSDPGQAEALAQAAR